MALDQRKLNFGNTNIRSDSLHLKERIRALPDVYDFILMTKPFDCVLRDGGIEKTTLGSGMDLISYEVTAKHLYYIDTLSHSSEAKFDFYMLQDCVLCITLNCIRRCNYSQGHSDPVFGSYRWIK